MRQHLRVILSLGYVTFREILRDKILYNVLVMALLLFGAGYLASRVSFVRQERLLLDFGATAMVVTNLLIAAITGASQLNREIERRTLHLALSRPIYRIHIILGKFLGLASILFLNTMITGGVLFILLTWATANPIYFLPAFSETLLLNFMQSMLIASVAILFSTFTTSSLSAILAIGVYLIGTNVPQLAIMAQRSSSRISIFTLKTLGLTFPDLSHFNLGTQLSYGLTAPMPFMRVAVIYSAAYSLACLCIGAYFLDLREI